MQSRISQVFLTAVLICCINGSIVFCSDYVDRDFELQYKEFDVAAMTGLGKTTASKNRIVYGDSPLETALARTEALLNSLEEKERNEKYSGFRAKLETINSQRERAGLGKSGVNTEKGLFMEVMSLQREIAFNSEVTDFDSIIVVKGTYSGHMCGYGVKWSGRGIRLITDAFSENSRDEDFLDGATVINGSMQGKTLSDGFSPEVTYDGKYLYFSASTEKTYIYGYDDEFGGPGSNEARNIFRIRMDGTELTQITDESQTDFDPCELPDGRIVFISTRRDGNGRCHQGWRPTYTLYSMDPDGSDLYCISYHETNEWHPSVDNDGKIIYSRWDYVDRDSDIAHHMWECLPDGRDPRSRHSNYPLPLSTINGEWKRGYPEELVASYGDDYKSISKDVRSKMGPLDGRAMRPWMEQNMRAIPGVSGKYLGSATGHHCSIVASVISVDTRIPDDNLLSQVTRLTPDAPFPESEEYCSGPYRTPYPLSEEQYLVCYEPTDDDPSSLYLMDVFGNRQLVHYGDFMDPIPVRIREKPPVIPRQTFQGDRYGTAGHKRAVVSVNNIYESDMAWPENTKIKWMRIVQLFSKTTGDANDPKISRCGQSLVRMSLGIVPVEDDGSVYFQAPVGRSIYFQALDENYMAVHSMRSATYVHPGEHLSCTGCHEDKWKATPGNPSPTAIGKDPIEMGAEPGYLEPVSFYRTVQPVLVNTCIKCHQEKGKGPKDTHYKYWAKKGFCFSGGNGAIMNPEDGGSRTIPGRFGAMESDIGKAFRSKDVHKDLIGTDEYRQICMWIDLNSNEYGAYYDIAKQEAGEFVAPRVDYDPDNLQSVEWNRPLPGQDTVAESGMRANGSYNPVVRVRNGRVIIGTTTGADVHARLCNMQGRVVREWTVRAQNHTVEIDALSGIGKGMYFFVVDEDPRSRFVLTNVGN